MHCWVVEVKIGTVMEYWSNGVLPVRTTFSQAGEGSDGMFFELEPGTSNAKPGTLTSSVT